MQSINLMYLQVKVEVAKNKAVRGYITYNKAYTCFVWLYCIARSGFVELFLLFHMIIIIHTHHIYVH